MFSCHLCHGKFKCRFDLKTHIDAVHLGLKEHSCNLCSKTFARVGDLNRHTKIQHEGIRSFPCTECSKTFGTRYGLNRHTRRLHTDPSPNKVSRGELAMRRFLTYCGITFETEKKFVGLRGSGGRPLRYDFAVPTSDGGFLLLEYDGEQHFRPVKFSKSQTDSDAIRQFVTTRRHDEVKNEFARAQGFPMLRIAYYEVGKLEYLVGRFLAEHPNVS